MIKIDLDIFTGTLVYRMITFSFVFDKKELRLIPPEDKRLEIELEWFMHRVSEGVYAQGFDDQPVMEDSYLIGKCNEDGSNIVFITQQGASLGRYNSVLSVEIVSYIIRRHGNRPINRICFCSPELNCIYPLGQSFSLMFNEDEMEKGVVQLKTDDYNAITSKVESFEVDSKKIAVIFGASRIISYRATETPLRMNSSLVFEFEETDNYDFIYRLWRIAKQFVQYLCYRNNIYFTKVELSSPYDENKNLTTGQLYVLCDMGTHDAEIDILKKGRYIRQQYLEGSVGKILQSIADNTIYLRHLPKTYEDGRHIDAAKFVMITAAFEWEFSRIFPDGIKKKEKKIKAEETVEQLLTKLIESYTGEVKSILKYLKKCVGNDPLSSKLTFVGNELGDILNVFGKQLYKMNKEELKYSEMGIRLAAQRNNFAHGNLDKDFDGLSLLDLVFLERILYAMQLSCYGVPKIKIKMAINDLFQCHIMITE